MLRDFEARVAAGEAMAGMEHAAVVDRDGKTALHYMKAIPVKQLCTVCHGTRVDPGLAAAIRARYPEDRATGFRVGELRGAFTLTRPLD